VRAWLLASACVAAAACVTPLRTSGTAQVIRWGEFTDRLMLDCSTGARLQIGMGSSNYTFDWQIEKWLAENEGPLLLDFAAIEGPLPSDWPAARDADRAVSLVRVSALRRGSCDTAKPQ